MQAVLAAGLVLLCSIRAECTSGTQGDSNSSISHMTDENGYGDAKAIFVNGSLVCELKCQQGTIFYADNTCRCLCRKNYGLYLDTRCERVHWSSWSSWSKCLRSDWGGLQLRERACKSREIVFYGACAGRGSMARTCSPVSKEFRIRKNVNDLTNEELHDILQAMTKFKKDKTKRGYRNIISWHGYPGKCPWYRNIYKHDNHHCSWHHHPMFQPWHRLITINLELGLSRYLKNKTLGIPYWDWTENATDIPYLLRDPEIYDPILKKSIKNPFHSTFIKYHNGAKLYNQRKPSYSGLLMNRYLLKGTVRSLLCHDHVAYDTQNAIVPHDQIHNCFCIEEDEHEYKEYMCDFGMGTTDYAAWDPAFLIHHSAMDRLFVIRRELEELNGVADWTESRVISPYENKFKTFTLRDISEAFDWPMSPFCNKSMNPETVTKKEGIWTMHNSFYNEQLFGYKYDNFNFGLNYKWEDLQKDFESNVIQRNFYNDDYFVTKLGVLTPKNAQLLQKKGICTKLYSNPEWKITIEWR